MTRQYACPVQATSSVFAGKWKVLILWHLGFGARRFAEIRELLPGVSEKVLTDQLRQLERDGVVRRTAAAGFPRRVDYELSAAGTDLLFVMERMCAWSGTYLGVLPTLPGIPPMLAASTR
jgi:DNA-binding HxlR family transcriptional regulator